MIDLFNDLCENLEVNAIKEKILKLINFLEKEREQEPILGHKQCLFFEDQKYYLHDYLLKRATMATAITEKTKQKFYMAFAFLLLDKFQASISMGKYWKFVKEKISPSTGYN